MSERTGPGPSSDPAPDDCAGHTSHPAAGQTSYPAAGHTVHPVAGHTSYPGTDEDTQADLTHVRAMWADDKASAALGIEVLELGVDTTGPQRLGHARARMRIVDTMVNGHDIVHGGYIFTLADSTFALACNATGRLTVAAGCDITFVTSARLDDVLVADARERLTYGRSGLTDVTVFREADGQVVAEFRGRSRSLQAR